MSSKSISLSLNKTMPQVSSEVRNVFGDEDSDDEVIKPQTSAEKSQNKYGNLKARDERAVKKVLDENPDIYDYDAAYDMIQQKRVKIREDKESELPIKKPRYIDNFMNAKKKRDLERLLRDERKQEKERVAEGDEFKDKDVFITSSYRQQLEETVKFRKELEVSDKIDDLTAISRQKMWRENFGKKLFEDRMRERLVDSDEEEKNRVEKKPQNKDNTAEARKKVEAEVETEKSTHKERRQNDKHSSNRRRQRDWNDEKHDRVRDIDRRHNQGRDTDRRRDSDHSADRKRHRDYGNRRRDRSRGGDRGRGGDRSREGDRRHGRDQNGTRSDDQNKPCEEPRKLTYREAKELELKNRLEAVRKILTQRNTPKTIEEACKRYFKRRQSGLIVPPI